MDPDISVFAHCSKFLDDMTCQIFRRRVALATISHLSILPLSCCRRHRCHVVTLFNFCQRKEGTTCISATLSLLSLLRQLPRWLHMHCLDSCLISCVGSCLGGCLHSCLGSCLGICLGNCSGGCLGGYLCICLGARLDSSFGSCKGSCLGSCLGGCLNCCLD